MKVFVVLLLAALVAVNAVEKRRFTDDPCLDVSQANDIATLWASSGSPYPSGPSAVEGNAILNNLYLLTLQVSSSYKYFGQVCTRDNLCYGIANCYYNGPEKRAACGTSTGYIASVVNAPLFGDSKIHSFSVNADGEFDISDSSLQVFVTVGDYFAATRPWWQQAEQYGPGWSEGYPFFNGLSFGQTLTEVWGEGYVAIDRLYREPCAVCLHNSDPVGVTQALAAALTVTMTELRTDNEISSMVSYLYDLFQQTKTTTISELFIGTADDRFVGVINCDLVPTSPACAGDNKWGAYVLVPDVTGTRFRQNFAVTAGGQIAHDQKFSDATNIYVPTARPWYIVGNGWTDPYIDFTTGRTLRTYAASFEGGVAGADATDALIAQPCPKSKSHINW